MSTTIDKEFKEVVDKINAKLAEAAASVAEANRLASEAGIKALVVTEFATYDMSSDEQETFSKVSHFIDVSALENALDTAGWSTSSSYC